MPTFQDEQLKRLNYLIRRMHQTADALYLEEAGIHDVTSVQMACLRAIEARPGTDQLRLAHALKLDRTTVAGVVLRLERKQLIIRERDKADRRSMLLYVTPAGERLLETLIIAVDRAQRRMLAPLKPAERRTLLELMARLVENERIARPVSGSVQEDKPAKRPIRSAKSAPPPAPREREP